MDDIAEYLDKLDYSAIVREIEQRKAKFVSHFDIVRNYALVLGSKDDNVQRNKEIFDIISNCTKLIVDIYQIVTYTKDFKFIHKNEKVECLYKIKPKTENVNEYVNKLISLFDEITTKNESYIKNAKFILNDDKDNITLKESLNQCLIKEKEMIMNYKENAMITFTQSESRSISSSNANSLITSFANSPSVIKMETSKRIRKKKEKFWTDEKFITIEIIISILIIYYLFL